MDWDSMAVIVWLERNSLRNSLGGVHMRVYAVLLYLTITSLTRPTHMILVLLASFVIPMGSDQEIGKSMDGRQYIHTNISAVR